MNLIRESILAHLAIYDSLTHERMIELMLWHGFTEKETLDELEKLILSRRVMVKNMRIFHIETKPEEIDPAYLAAADAYRESKPTWVQRLRKSVANFLSCLVLSLALSLSAQEMPAWVLPGMLMIESSSYYHGSNIVYVNQKRGASGEVGLCQAMPSTLRQFGFSPSLYEQDTQYAQDATITILSHYYKVTGSWSESVGAWNCGLGNRKSQTAINYTKRVYDAGQTK